ncbi:OFA family MFS transporter [Methylovirgula sp. HY1]|uniref:OFA family MFS transporter n=1 Tax=Methylovirgula sp. HY1 TaxID=2822761 RepID=UPI001C5A73F4|nr:OFA family MFS transporter [Methylovirgula sp. HY1]QXX76314.1 Oxalate:formate antiporter [Methylovirgula sp. HY1]
MSTYESTAGLAVPGGGLLARERTVAGPRFNRWLVPPAALAIHLSIGMAYGMSVFWKPMGRLIAHAPASCAGQDFFGQLVTASCNWTIPSVTPVFEIFIAVLGISAAIWGGWLEHAGPRKAGFIAALCWGGGLALCGVGVSIHQLWLLYIAAVIAGVGQGLGYITPVSTLIKWFPDRRGLATGFAIMGYGGGAMIGAPLAVWLMHHLGSGASLDVAHTMMIMGGIYFVAMTLGAFGFRVAPSGWKPVGFMGNAVSANAMITSGNVHLDRAWKTPQFWLIWGVLCLNVTAGIGVISMASPMLTEIFGAKLVGAASATSLSTAQTAAIAAAAAGLVGLISLFNSLGRLFWAALSDKIGRKNMYYTIFVIGIVVYSLLPTWGHLGMPAVFVVSICIILSMYGGGFSTVPAYLADIFGPQMVGAIHGRLITAWSVAGVAGPFLIANIRQFQISHGVPHARVYDITLYIMAFLLFCGLICNAFVKPVHDKHLMTDEEVARERALLHEDRVSADADKAARGSFGIGGVVAWAAVGIPFSIGLYIALAKAAKLF